MLLSTNNKLQPRMTMKYILIKLFFRASGDGGRDIIVEMDGYRFVVQCKAWYYKCIGREEADAFLTVVRRGNFDFGILVGVLEQKIAKGAYNAADESGGDIIVTLYTRMCQDIK
ncbi:24295_t:CDS:2, partial [Racocetra persica]